MINFVSELTNQFRSVLLESYHEKNKKETVAYPYLTFDFDSEEIEDHVEGFYIDVDIFDSNSSYVKILEIEDKLKWHFYKNRKLTDDLYLRFHFLRSNKVPTVDDLIKRRNLQIYCKVDWRNK
ncbi:hypothetical protein [Tepidibacillus marianensis]|uniref:hypothetical protein n=1 Tax=Tepidibacillus marianensis TaxID=3131995 RepID=UPI0030D36C47